MTTPHREDYRAQYGEDRILAEHFGNKTHGCCVEIGAYDGIELSNSYYFEQLGWKCVLVEAIPHLAERARVNRPKSQIFQCAVVAPGSTGRIDFVIAEDTMELSSISLDSYSKNLLQRYHGRIATKSITVPARTLDEILYESGIAEIDFITIDVEGHEYNVLRGFDIDHWKPSILILERNEAFPNWRIIMQLFICGYVLFKTTGVNDWYRPDSQNAMEGLAYGWRIIHSFYIKRLSHKLKMKFSRFRSRVIKR